MVTIGVRRQRLGAAAALLSAALTPAPLAAAEPELFAGRPAFAEGSDRSYFVWNEGREWHVRWTTPGRTHRFTGTISADGGELKSLKRIDVDTERKVIAAGRSPRVVRGPRGRRHVRPGRAPVVVSRDEDRIEKDGDGRIVWVSRTDDDIDGFNFKVTDQVRGLRFRLEIDGESRPADVEVGRDNRRLVANPFSVELVE